MDSDARAVVDAGLWGRAKSVAGVAEQMGWEYLRAEKALEEMQQAYAKRSASKVWVVGDAE